MPPHLAHVPDLAFIFLRPVNLVIGAWSRARVSIGQYRLSYFWKCFRKQFCDVTLHCLQLIL